MSPESSFGNVSTEMEAAFKASFRCGRNLVAILAVSTGGFLFVESLYEYLAGKNTGGIISLLIGWVFIGWICWCLFRGGSLAGGCLLFLSIPIFLGLLLGTLALVFNTFMPGGNFSAGVDRFREIGSDWKTTLGFLPFGAWATYAVWVLLVSKNARLYREARRQGIAEADAKAFVWPPAGRRPQ